MIRIGLVGYGFGGRNFHAPIISSNPDCILAGVVTKSPGRREELAADFPKVPAFDSMDDLIDSGIDAVVISVPPAARFKLILEAMEKGIPTVSDKPFALNRKDALTLAETSKTRKVPLTAYMNRRWDSDFLTVKKLLKSGNLGEIRRFYSGIEMYAPENKGNPAGGGLLRDLGSHLVDQAFNLLGPVDSVYAKVDKMPFDAELNDAFYIVFNHKSGIQSHINGFMHQHLAGPRFKVDGTAGCFIIEGLDIQNEQALSRKTPLSKDIQWGVEPEDRWGKIHSKGEVKKYPSENGCWQEFYNRFAGAVMNNIPLPVEINDAIAVTTILDAALISSRENRVVFIKELEG